MSSLAQDLRVALRSFAVHRGFAAHRRRLQIPAVRAGPSIGDQFALEIDLALAEIGRMHETLGVFGSVRVYDAQNVATFGRVVHFISQKLSASFKPPEH